MPYEPKGEKAREHIKGAPQDVNDTYNAIMRDKHHGDDSEENQSSAAAIAWAQHNKKKGTMGIQDGPVEKKDGNRKCPNCDAILQENVGYDACPVCGRHLKEGAYRVISISAEDPWQGALPAQDEKMWAQQQPAAPVAQPGVDPLQQPFNMAPGAPPVGGDPMAPLQGSGPGEPYSEYEFDQNGQIVPTNRAAAKTARRWLCPECGAANEEHPNPGGRGIGWHDCPNCGYQEGFSEGGRHQPRDFEYEEEGADPHEFAERNLGIEDHFSKYKVVALGEMQQPGGVGATQTTGPVNSDTPEDTTDPGISTDAGENSFEQNVALETWVNYAVDMLNRGKDEQTVLSMLAHDGCPDPKGVLKRALEQPEESPVPNEGAEDPFDVPFKDEQTADQESVSHQPPVVETTASWQPDWRRIERHSSDANELGGPIGEPADDTAPKKPDQENVFDVDGPSGDDQADLFDVDEPKATDNHVAPIEFKDEVSQQKTKDVHKSNRVRIAGTSWKGIVQDEWEDMWGSKLVRVALSDGGSIDVDPSRVVPDDPSVMEHPVTEIEKFISSLPAVEPTRPSIMARLANLEIIRRAVRSNISKVGFSDQIKLERIDLDAQVETRELREVLPHIRNEFDKSYLASLPRYVAGDGTQAQDPEFNEKIAERAAIFVEEIAPETRADSRALASAAPHYAAANNGNVAEFVNWVQKHAKDWEKPWEKKDDDGDEHEDEDSETKE